MEWVQSPSAVYKLRITLLDVDPSVWRTVLVSDRDDFERLDLIIQEAMGWTNSHLHMFDLGELARGTVAASPRDFDEDGPERWERGLQLRKVKLKKGSQFLYTYDLGDSWEHLVEVDEVLPAMEVGALPVCLDGARACPPEDCGGSSGYEELLEILSAPKHPEHRERRSWLGRRFDPEAFTTRGANRRLASLRWKPARTRRSTVART